jgi:hypothetical protein
MSENDGCKPCATPSAKVLGDSAFAVPRVALPDATSPCFSLHLLQQSEVILPVLQ